jgi:hypothetical protein
MASADFLDEFNDFNSEYMDFNELEDNRNEMNYKNSQDLHSNSTRCYCKNGVDCEIDIDRRLNSFDNLQILRNRMLGVLNNYSQLVNTSKVTD